MTISSNNYPNPFNHFDDDSVQHWYAGCRFTQSIYAHRQRSRDLSERLQGCRRAYRDLYRRRHKYVLWQ